MRLIDADAFVKYLENEIRLMEEDGASPYALMIASGAINDVSRQPTIEAVPKDFHDKTCEAMAKRHTEEIQRLMPKCGEWIETPDGTMCGNCHKFPYDDGEYHIANWYSDFCPNCGADMREQKLKSADEDTAFGGLMSAT